MTHQSISHWGMHESVTPYDVLNWSKSVYFNRINAAREALYDMLSGYDEDVGTDQQLSDIIRILDGEK